MTQHYNITYVSLFLFLITSYVGLYVNKIVYAFLFLSLFITSFMYRLFYNDLSLIADVIVICLVGIYGIYMLYIKYKYLSSHVCIFIIFTTLIGLYIFYYGYFTKQYAYDPEKSIGYLYQSLIHCLAVTNHLILMLA